MAPGWTQILLVLVLVLVLFGGRGRISSIMGDLAKGITSFRKGLKDEEASAGSIADKGETIEAETTPERDRAES